MSFLDNLFGAGANSAIMGIGNNSDDFQDASRYAQQAAQYSSAQQNRFVSHNWVFNGQPCSLKEFANEIWGTEDHPDKMIFILTHSGPKSRG